MNKLNMESGIFDVIVVGAGLSGIIAAQRYLDIHPKALIVILEKDSVIGGVFSQRRIYNTFWTQWTVGLSEFPDMSMEPPPDSDRHHDFYRAKWTSEYLEQYVDRKHKDGSTLRERIFFGIEAKSIKKAEDMWDVACDDEKGSRRIFSASKLVIASGLTSVPNMPTYTGTDQLGGPVLHSEDFGANEDKIPKSNDIKYITVIGGGKSSADMIYESVKAGKEVSWVISTAGTGAPYFAKGEGKGGFKNAFEAASTRFTASLQPSIFNNQNLWTNFLHRTHVGNLLLGFIFEKLDAAIRAEANYKGRNSDKGFEKLEYDAPFFWQNGTGGLLHHEDFWDLVASNVYMHRDAVESLEKGTVNLKNEGKLRCDAVLCGTGWKPSIQFFDQEYLVLLELPHDPKAESIGTTEKWAKLDAEADEFITTSLPMLANPPPHQHKHNPITPYRLYQGMAPVKDDSVVMVNHTTTGNKIMTAEVQAMWAVAYLDKNINIPSPEEREREISQWVAFSRRRYLSNGEMGNNIAFETVTYANTLLKQMGLSKHWKESWWKHVFEPFWPRDLGRAWEEYRMKVGALEVKTEGKNESVAVDTLGTL